MTTWLFINSTLPNLQHPPCSRPSAGQCWGHNSDRQPGPALRPWVHCPVGDTDLSPDRGDSEWAGLGEGSPGACGNPEGTWSTVERLEDFLEEGEFRTTQSWLPPPWNSQSVRRERHTQNNPKGRV